VLRALKWVLFNSAMAASVSAQTQAPVSRPGWPCIAGRAVDPSYVRVAEATGGQVFLFDRSEAGRSLVLVRNTSKHEDTIFRSTGTLSTGSREFSFPVDSTVESLMVSVSLQCLQSITVYRPSNTEVHGGEPDADENRFKSGLILILAKPAAGEWRIRIAGIGMFFAVVTAKSSISLDRAEFVEPGGRPGHEGLFPVKGPVHVGEQRTLSVSMTAPNGEKRFRLVDPAGETLAPLDLKPGAEGGDKNEFWGACVVKYSAFRVAVQGVDEAGYPYQRVLARPFAASPAN
jgi:hypothetical protein